MSLRLVARGLAFAAGLFLLFIAAAFLMVLSTGNFAQGRTAAQLSVVAYLAAAMPLRAWPFSTAVASADALHVLEGTMSFLINGQWVDCPPGSFVMAPAGCVNDFQNRGSVRAGVLNLSAPGAASARWRTHGPPSTRPGRALRPIAAGHDRSR